MPLTNLEKVRECFQIVGTDVFNTWEVRFLCDTSKKLEADEALSPKQQRKLDELYDKACNSPY